MRDVLGRFGPMTSILAPGAIAGLNENQDWEQNYYNNRMAGLAVAEEPVAEEPVAEERGPGGAREEVAEPVIQRPVMPLNPRRMFKRQLNADEKPTDEELEWERMAEKAKRMHSKSKEGVSTRKALRTYKQRKGAEEEEEEEEDYSY